MDYWNWNPQKVLNSSPGQFPVSPSWKGSVKVLLVNIVSALNLKPIRVDAGDEIDVGGVNNSSNPRVLVVVLGQVPAIKSSLIPGLSLAAPSPGQTNQQLPPDHLVAVDVGHVLDHWPQERSGLPHVAGNVKTFQFSALFTCTETETDINFNVSLGRKLLHDNFDYLSEILGYFLVQTSKRESISE